MEIIMYQVDAFSDEIFGGNPAGVIPNNNNLNERTMQKIARELNLSETAFIEKIEEDKYNVRFFTPTNEVDLCGHATIASFYTLAIKGYIKGMKNGVKRVYQQTRVGELYVDIYYKEDNVDKIMMEQSKPKKIKNIRDYKELSEALNIEERHIGIEDKNINPEIISTGLPDIILPIKNKYMLDNIKINKNKVAQLSKKLDVTGIHLFTIEDGEIYTRNFAPLVGIDEEAATGTANGALFYYLRENKLIQKNSIISHQGEALKRPSEIICKLSNYNSSVIEVGGSAKIVIEGVIQC